MRFYRYIGLFLASLPLAAGSVSVPAGAQERCNVARLHPMGVLEHCEDQFAREFWK